MTGRHTAFTPELSERIAAMLREMDRRIWRSRARCPGCGADMHGLRCPFCIHREEPET